jgi:hypothetical protein
MVRVIDFAFKNLMDKPQFKAKVREQKLRHEKQKQMIILASTLILSLFIFASAQFLR